MVARDWYRFFLNLLNKANQGGGGTGTVTSVNVSGGTTGLTTSGGPVTTSGTITLAGTLDVDNGGTGAATASGARTNLGAAASGANSDITSMSGITGGISTPQFIQMDDGTGQALVAGKMWYTPATGAWNLGMGGGNITQQVGEELFVYGKASAAITDSPLQIVYHTGTVGSSGTITFAPTIAGITDINAIVGVATESIALNGFGRVTNFGVVHNIATNGTAYGETWADDDVIWYNPVTGNPTNVEPSAPNIKVQVGIVITAGPGGSGSFQVLLRPGSVLGGTDSNVQFSSLVNKDLIQYDSALQYWKNVTPGSVTGVGSVANALTAGTGISYSVGTTYNGSVAVTINNSAPDQTVSLTGGTGISTSGAYPNFTITNTLPMTYPGVGIPNSTGTAWGTSYTTTGSGTVVALATSPSFTTPILGTPQSGNFSTGTFTWPTFNQNTTGSAATLTTGRTISISGDLTYTSPSFNGSANVTAAGTLATVNANVGSFTNASITVNAKGLITAASSGTAPVTSVTGTSPVVSSGGATPAISLASGYGDTQNPYASKTANFFLAAPNGLAGVPTFRAIAAADIPTLNQNTTGTASNVTGTVAIANGGTGQTTQQTALNALAGAVTSGQYLRGNGTNVVMSAIQAADVPTLNQNTTGTASNVTGTVAIANGGTGQTTKAAAFNALSPVTTLGDIIYGDGANSNTRLAGNTSATKNFLAQTGTGTVSAAPVWSTVTKSDVGLGNVENTALSTWAGSTNLTTLGTIATGTWNATTISVSKGGTGLTSIAALSVPVANTANTYSTVTGTAGQSIRVNAGGTAWEAYTPNAGTVTSVTGTSPVVSSGGATPAISLASGYGDTQNPYASKTANFFLAAPNGVAGVPTFRAIVAADIPTLNQNTTGTASNVTGVVALANGGSGQTTAQAAMNTFAGAVTSGQYLRGNGTNVVMSAIQAADVPTLNQNTTGTASNVTGTVAIANGGTGQTTKLAAFDALSPATTKGDLIAFDGLDNVRLPVGVNNYVLTADSTQTTGMKWAPASGSGATISNDTTTASNLYPTFVSSTSGALANIYTSNAKYLYKPSTGELTSPAVVASNGIFVNSLTISTSYTIPTGSSGMSAGTISVANGVTVTVSNDSRWVVV